MEENLEQNDEKSLVAICYSNKVIGVACFMEISNTIYADCINVSTDDIENVLYHIKTICSPTLFLIHPQILSNKPLLDMLTSGSDGMKDFHKFKPMKSSSWNPEHAFEIICNKLCLAKHSSSMRLDQRRNYLYLSSILDLDSVQLRQALGALLIYMQSNTFKLDDGKVVVSCIQTLPSANYMKLDSCSYRY
jgi:hypothetical protein